MPLRTTWRSECRRKLLRELLGRKCEFHGNQQQRGQQSQHEQPYRVWQVQHAVFSLPNNADRDNSLAIRPPRRHRKHRNH